VVGETGFEPATPWSRKSEAGVFQPKRLRTSASKAPLDRATLDYAVEVLQERLAAVEVYGAGGCPTCHDAELRGSIAKLRELAVTSKPEI